MLLSTKTSFSYLHVYESTVTVAYLEDQQAASAPYVVTGNIKDFPDSWHDIRIVTPRRFLEIMSGETEPTRHV